MLDDFGQRIRDIILSEMDLSRELSDEEICDLIGSVVSREARDRPMTIKDVHKGLGDCFHKKYGCHSDYRIFVL